MPRSVSIRRSLLWHLVLMIVAMGGAIMATTFLGARRAGATLSAALINRTFNHSDEQLRHFFDPVMQELAVARSWGEAGLLAAKEPEALNRMFVPLMRRYPQVSSLLVADERGREYMLLHTRGTWTTRQTRRDEWGERTRWLEWSDDKPEPVETWKEQDYDPRNRPWYTGALEQRAAAARDGQRAPALRNGEHASNHPASIDPLVHWTQPYTFFTTKEPGITASLAFDAPNFPAAPPGADAAVAGDGPAIEPGAGSAGRLQTVIGFDVLLRDITEFTRALRVSDNGGVMVLTEDGRVIGLPAHRYFDDAARREAALLKHADELGWPLASDANRAFRSRAESKADSPLRFISAGQAWWGQARPFTLSGDRTLIIAVVIPEADLLGNLLVLRYGILLISLAVLVFGVARAAVLARRFSEPIEALVRESDRISAGDLAPRPALPSSVKEVRRLAEAHERMRTGLQNLMKLEADLRLARQIQQSTFPEVLPQIEGFELDAWSEPAEQTGGDTYDVIGYTYDAIEYRGEDGAHPRAATDATASRGLATDRADRAVLLLADATGHGIGPALSVTQVRAMLRMAVRMRQRLPAIIRHLNEQLRADLPDGRFVTTWLAELDGSERTLTSFSAGQGPLIRYDAGQRECELRVADAPPLGVLDDIRVTLAPPIVMARGDIFAVISDGIFEAMNPADEQFGPERVVAVIKQHHAEGPTRILAALREAVQRFSAGRPADDDRTAILIKRR